MRQRSSAQNNRHVAFVAFSGLRVAEEAMLELGMRLPGLGMRARAIAKLPALGLLTLAGLTPDDWTCSYHESSPGDDDELLRDVMSTEPKLVALSALTASVLDAYRFSQALREHNVLTVIGGLHATACPTEAGHHCDSVVAGDGEPVWRQLLQDAANGELKPLYRSNSPFNLADSPLPRFDLLGSAVRKRMTMQTQRGCPLACEFCGASRLLGRFREKPVDRIRKELAAICRVDTHPLIELADDNTFAARKDIDDFFEVLQESGARYFTEADWRIGERPEVLKGLARSGCMQVLMGIESLLQRPTGMGAKAASWSRIQDAIHAVQDAGVCVVGCFIVGCDGETRASIDRLADFIDHSPLADIQLTVQTPFPGTELHQRMSESGRLLTHKTWSAYTLFDVTYEPDRLKPEELQEAFYHLILRTFGGANAQQRAVRRQRIWQNHARFQTCQSQL